MARPRAARRLVPVLLAMLAVLVAGGALLFPTTAHAGPANGHLPRSALVHVVTAHGCYFLRADAGAAYNTMQLAAGRRLYVNGCDSTYRPYARQVYYRASWCALGHCENAAVPGTSNHGLGLAADIPTSTRAIIDRVGVAYGWCKGYHPTRAGPCGPSDASWEPWHYRWTAGIWHRHPNPGTSLRSPTLRVGSGGPGQAPFVRQVQRRLGFRHPNGRYQQSTAHAVARFQRLKKLHPTGVVAGPTWQAIRHQRGRIAPASREPRLLRVTKPRLHGGDVLALEQALNSRRKEGHLAACPTSGVYTKRVARCVRAFQRSRHITADGVVGPQTWEAIRTKAPAPPVHNRPLHGRVIDVSMHDGNVNWTRVVHRNSVQGVWLKLSEGQDYRDPSTTAARLVQIRNAGLPYGFYHFLRPRAGRDPCSSEVAWFIAQAHALGGWGSMRPVFDVEATALGPAATGRYVERTESCFAHRTGIQPVTYTGWYFWQDHGRFTIPGCRVWLAAYTPKPPPTPGPGCRHYHAWQYTDHGSIAGIHGNVDVSYVPDLSKTRLPAKR